MASGRSRPLRDWTRPHVSAPSAAASPRSSTDVVVLGGGPAGSTIATLLARKGWQVALLERDRHPRFHIGESLLPMNLPILDRLGLLEATARIGVLKRGADFPAANADGYGVFRFDRALNGSPPHAYQVRRDQFDEMLFRHAVAAGARGYEQATVDEVRFDTDRVGVTAHVAKGRRLEFDARYLVDASGRQAFLGRRLGLLRKHEQHQSAAMFAHFEGVTRRPGADAGNISIVTFEHGWIWLIPLPDGLMSIGAVCWPDYLKRRHGAPVEFLLETLRSVPDVSARMNDARLVQNLHATGNYSYRCKEIAGPRWIMVGDASGFVDPIFSTGVYLAMTGAEEAARVVDGTLRNPRCERALQQGYTRRVGRGLARLSWFIRRFTSPAMRHLFANPRNVFGIERAMISMLAGDVFDSPTVLRRLRLFKALYYCAAIGRLPASVANARRRHAQARVPFSGGTTSQDPQ
jgi:flavin-dependent dehydrogenase